jgi:hypothetical protein
MAAASLKSPASRRAFFMRDTGAGYRNWLGDLIPNCLFPIAINRYAAITCRIAAQDIAKRLNVLQCGISGVRRFGRKWGESQWLENRSAVRFIK